MGLIALPRGWSTQPSDVAEIDWSHPFLQGALAIVDPVAGVERVTGDPLTPLFGSEKITDGPYGRGFYTGNNAKWSFKGRTPPDVAGNREISFFALTSVLSTPTQTYAGIVGAQAPSQTGLITTNVASRLDWYWSNRAAQNLMTMAAGKTYAAYGRANIVAANTVQGAGGEFEQSPGSFAAGAGSAGALGYLTDWYLGGDHRYATSRFIEQLVHLVIIVNRYCDEDEFRAMAANPWQIYKRPPLFIPFGSVGGSTHDLAASGSATAAGSATPSADYALAAVGVVVASGTAQTRAEVSVAAVGYALADGAANIDGSTTSDLSAAGAAQSGGSADLVASVTIGAADLATAAGSAGLSVDVLLAGAGAAQAAGNAALAATLSALAAGAAQAGGSATLSGGAAGELDASGGATAGGAAALTLVAELVATGAAQSGGSAVIEGGAAGELAASGGSQAAGQAQARLEAHVTAAGFVQAMGAGYLVIQGALSAQGAAGAGGAAQLVNASALVLIKSPRFVVRAAGRQFSVAAPGRTFKVSR